MDEVLSVAMTPGEIRLVIQALNEDFKRIAMGRKIHSGMHGALIVRLNELLCALTHDEAEAS